jgi:hypothetical protein
MSSVSVRAVGQSDVAAVLMAVPAAAAGKLQLFWIRLLSPAEKRHSRVQILAIEPYYVVRMQCNTSQFRLSRSSLSPIAVAFLATAVLPCVILRAVSRKQLRPPRRKVFAMFTAFGSIS